MHPVEEANTFIKGSTGLLKLAGPITIICFILLATLIGVLENYTMKANAEHVVMQTSLDITDKKIDSILSNNSLTIYYERRICENTATTDLARESCNPIPQNIKE